MPTLNWIGKEKVQTHHLDVPYRIMEHGYGFTTENGEQFDPVESGNKIIYGDNLEALKSLLPFYEGKVDCIYIDPPYNTGNEQWVYNDNVNHPKIKKWLGQVVGKESEDLSRHDKWLCMMYPRLQLLKQLLSDTGVIFISIDDNEQANLKLICDEIFGARNFINTFVKKSVAGRQDSKHYAMIHEYLLCYSKNIVNFVAGREIKEDDRFPFYHESTGYNYKTQLLRKWGDNSLRENRPNLFYPIYFNEETLIISTNKQSESDIEVYPMINSTTEGCWRWSKETMQSNIDSHRVEIKQRNNEWIGYERVFENTDEPLTKPYTTWIDEVQNSTGKTLVKHIFNQQVFDYPKATDYIEKIISMATSNKNALILDSFAGSGTTAHAVLNLNKKDGGNRKFILIELEDYANDITAERVKRVIKGYGEGNNAVEGTGGDFNIYTLGQSLLDDERNLNIEMPMDAVCSYIWYTETHTAYEKGEYSLPLLGVFENTAYYLKYIPNEVTTLDRQFLKNIDVKANQYVIYADNCLLPKELMQKYNIIFKKIPRDISQF